ANDVDPVKAIGSVNFAEFFVTVAESVTFIILLGPENYNWLIVLSLIIGGVICAPIAAWVCKKIPRRILGIQVGLIVMILSVRMILKFVGLI
ncbi:MAG: TSUP family transporter, partial [Thermoproteota archaeon]